MQKFIKYLLLFLLPVIVFLLSQEILLRKIPNDYGLKEQFLNKNSNKVSVLFLGSSHAYYGINPYDFGEISFNASQVSQSLDFDYMILQKYENSWQNLKYIAIPISYFSFFTTLETGGESWRVKNYSIYFGIKTSNNIKDYSEVLSNKLDVNIGRLKSFYINKKSGISCSSLGWGLKFNSKTKNNLISAGMEAAKRHTKKDYKHFEHNKNILKLIIEFSAKRKVKVFLYTPPAYYTYTENLNKTQLNTTIKTAAYFANNYHNVSYINLLNDSAFCEKDFFDADHLNEIGAKKLTTKIKSMIES